MVGIPVDDISDFRSKMLDYFHEEEDAICKQIDTTGQLSDDDRQNIIDIANKFREMYSAK